MSFWKNSQKNNNNNRYLQLIIQKKSENYKMQRNVEASNCPRETSEFYIYGTCKGSGRNCIFVKLLCTKVKIHFHTLDGRTYVRKCMAAFFFGVLFPFLLYFLLLQFFSATAPSRLHGSLINLSNARTDVFPRGTWSLPPHEREKDICVCAATPFVYYICLPSRSQN